MGWGLVVKLVPPEKVTRPAYKAFGMTDFSLTYSVIISFTRP